MTLFTIGVNDAKLIVMLGAKQDTPGQGYCHWPVDRAPEWVHPLTAERLVTRFVRGFPIREWKKTRDRNEALDCRVYAYAALKILNPNILVRLRRLKPDDDHVAEDETAAGEPPEEAKPKARKTRRGKTRRTRPRGSGRINNR